MHENIDQAFVLDFVFFGILLILSFFWIMIIVATNSIYLKIFVKKQLKTRFIE